MSSFASSSSVDTVINVKGNLIFTVSSMNPPTPGHVGVLIKRMMELAVQTGEQNVYVFFGSDKYDTIEYPLSCEERVFALNSMIAYLKRLNPDLGRINVIFMYEEGKNNGLRYFAEKLRQYFSIAPGNTKQINGFFVTGGTDRIDMINSVRSIVGALSLSHFRNHIELDNLPRDEDRNQKFGEGSFDPTNLSQISSTIVNKFVDSDNRRGFESIYNGWLPPGQIEWLWNRLKAVRIKGPGTVPDANDEFESIYSRTATQMGHNPKKGGKRRTNKRRRINKKKKTMRKRRTNKKENNEKTKNK